MSNSKPKKADYDQKEHHLENETPRKIISPYIG